MSTTRDLNKALSNDNQDSPSEENRQWESQPADTNQEQQVAKPQQRRIVYPNLKKANAIKTKQFEEGNIYLKAKDKQQQKFAQQMSEIFRDDTPTTFTTPSLSQSGTNPAHLDLSFLSSLAASPLPQSPESPTNSNVNSPSSLPNSSMPLPTPKSPFDFDISFLASLSELDRPIKGSSYLDQQQSNENDLQNRNANSNRIKKVSFLALQQNSDAGDENDNNNNNNTKIRKKSDSDSESDNENDNNNNNNNNNNNFINKRR